MFYYGIWVPLRDALQRIIRIRYPEYLEQTDELTLVRYLTTQLQSNPFIHLHPEMSVTDILREMKNCRQYVSYPCYLTGDLCLYAIDDRLETGFIGFHIQPSYCQQRNFGPVDNVLLSQTDQTEFDKCFRALDLLIWKPQLYAGIPM